MMRDLKFQIEMVREDLKATKGACGNGTIACRLWIALHGLVEVVEEWPPQLAAAHAKIAELQAVVDRRKGLPPVVCLCGSTRFMEAFFAAGWESTLQGVIVLSIGVCKHAADHGAEALEQDVADRLDELHKRKIDLADFVLVLNVEGYIGSSTRGEIEYARETGKPVFQLFDDELIPPISTPPSEDEFPSWHTITCATREAVAKYQAAKEKK